MVGREQVTIARGVAGTQGVDVRHLVQHVQPHHAVRQTDVMGAVQHPPYQRTEPCRGLVAPLAGRHEAVERLRVVGVDFAGVALGIDVLQQLQQAREPHLFVDHHAGSQLEQCLFAVGAQLAQVLAHHDLERGGARETQVVHQACAGLEIACRARIDQHRGGHAGGGSHFDVLQPINDAPVSGDTALPLHRCPGGQHTPLVGCSDQFGCGTLGARAVGSQPVGARVLHQAKARLKERTGVRAPAVQAQAPAVCVGMQRGNVHGHLAQVA